MAKAAPGQYSLDFSAKARKSDPATSKKAAEAKHGTIRALILNTLRTHGPLATFQIAEILNKDRDSISPHMKPLAKLGHIQRSGGTVIREKTKKECEIWQIAKTSE